LNPDSVGLYIDDGSRGPSIRIADGSRFFLLHPDQAAITPQVIAHSISQLCRFTGHTSPFYSVAQHCVMVSKLVLPDLAMAGLMHDASEAFIGDLSRPLKVLLDELAPGVMREVEERIHAAIAERFGFDYPHDPDIKYADNVAVATEIRDLLPPAPGVLRGLPAPLDARIQALDPRAARVEFLGRYVTLGGVL
jgi:5'-deoxynucleotidase YfbR-like HD superfamily hydrolase